MKAWMAKQKRVVAKITDEKERLAYFKKTVLPELSELEKKEQRTWDENRDDYDLDILERGYSEDDFPVLSRSLLDACKPEDWDDLIFSRSPADIHQLVLDRSLCHLLKHCADSQKILLFLMDVHKYEGASIAKAQGVDTRNITSVHERTLDYLRTHMVPLILLKFKLEHDPKWRDMARARDIYTTFEERYLCANNGEAYLAHWAHRFFEGITFDLTPITEHHKSEPIRKPIKKRKKALDSKDDEDYTCNIPERDIYDTRTFGELLWD
jgi:hypothetical protein